ncbi:TonB-dependent receptor [Roseivirga sp. BDSF3-8]|uniref:TonB-dependent receptor n=1 Tax=Roseivirga sp. BDSF3-8 TaxID=3241598 RepID=UPI0035326691
MCIRTKAASALTLLFLIVATVPLLAQKGSFKVTGRVLDAGDNQGLPGATLVIPETGRGLVTAADGSFSFSLPAGQYTLEVRFIGYQTVTRSLTPGKAQDLTITLQESDILTDEVVITGVRASAKTPVTYTEVSREELDKQNLGQDIPYLVNLEPSVVVTSDAGAGVGYTGIRIRGSDPTRINVTINGIPLNDAESQGVFWVNMPDFASSVENVQIQRGVGTSTNGAGAFGATVDLNTLDLNRQAYAELQNGFGSFNTWRHTVKAGTGLLNDRFAVDARLSKITSDGYIDRASSDLQSYYLSGGYYGEKSLVKLNVFSGKEKTYQAWYGVPESLVESDPTFNFAGTDNFQREDPYDNETDNYQQDHYQLIYSYEANPELSFNAALHYTYGRGYYEQFKVSDDLADYGLDYPVIGDSIITNSDLIRRRWLDNDFYGGIFSADYRPTEALQFIVGGGWNRYDGDHFGEIIWSQFAAGSEIRDRYYDNNAVKEDFNVYGKMYYEFTPGLNAFIDLQYRSVDYSFLGFDNNLNNVQQNDQLNFFNPKAGVTYLWDDRNRAYVSFGIAHREPNRDDYTQSTPDSRPRAEQLRNLELGYQYRDDRLMFNANYYLMDYKDQLVLTGEVNDVGAYIRTNIADSYRTGIELQAGYLILPNLQLNANATFSRNVIDSFTEFIDNYDEGGQEASEYSETAIALSPNVIAGSQLTYYPLAGLELSLLSKYVGKQYLDNTETEARSIDAYFVNDLRIRYSIKPKWMEEISFSLLINNILDEQYVSNGYTYGYITGGQTIYEEYYYPQAGTNFLFGTTFRF